MQIDQKTVQKIAKLARIKIEGSQADAMEHDLSQILTWVEHLNEAKTEGVEPMFAVNKDQMPERSDVVEDGQYPESIVKNASEAAFNMFVVPKVVE